VSQKKADGKRGSRINHDTGHFQVNQLALISDDLPLVADDDSNFVPIFDEIFDETFEQGDKTAIAMDDNLNLVEVSLLETSLNDEDLEDEEESEDDLVDEDNLDLGVELDSDEDDFVEEEEEEADNSLFADLHSGHAAGDRLEILPLAEADLPLICYIVVDRIAEIITRPLKDFKDDPDF
jgi:hypothetical protein